MSTEMTIVHVKTTQCHGDKTWYGDNTRRRDNTY